MNKFRCRLDDFNTNLSKVVPNGENSKKISGSVIVEFARIFQVIDP